MLDKKTKSDIQKICKWIEAHANDCAQKCICAYDESIDRIYDYAHQNDQALEEKEVYQQMSKSMDKVHDEVLSGKYCSDLDLDPKAGFAFSVAYSEKNNRLESIYTKIEKEGLLKESLSVLEQYDLPISKRQKIGMLLANCSDMPENYTIIPAMLVFGTDNKKVIPVRVGIHNGEIKEVLPPQIPIATSKKRSPKDINKTHEREE